MADRATAATRIQAAWRGFKTRKRIIFSVRQNFEEIVKAFEGDTINSQATYWPLHSKLCMPQLASQEQTSDSIDLEDEGMANTYALPIPGSIYEPAIDCSHTSIEHAHNGVVECTEASCGTEPLVVSEVCTQTVPDNTSSATADNEIAAMTCEQLQAELEWLAQAIVDRRRHLHLLHPDSVCKKSVATKT